MYEQDIFARKPTKSIPSLYSSAEVDGTGLSMNSFIIFRYFDWDVSPDILETNKVASAKENKWKKTESPYWKESIRIKDIALRNPF